MRLAFGDCVFDPEARVLLRGGRLRRLPPKAFHLLDLLLQSRPRAVPQSEIKDRLWPKTFVARSSLGRLMAQVREAIGDPADDPRLVRTVHRFGYAFCGTVTEADPRPSGVAFRLFWGSREIELREGPSVLGRVAGCAVVLDAPGVSRQHARIRVEDGAAVIEDLGSKNGTFVGARRLTGPRPLVDGDEIALGTVLLTVRALRPDRSTETVSQR